VSLIRARLPKALGELAEILYNVPAYWRLRAAQRRFAPDLIYERYNLFHLAGTLVSRRARVTLFVEVNAPIAEERSRFGGLRLQRLARALEATVWRSADRVLAVTGVLKGIVEAAGVPAERIEVVPNGSKPESFVGLRRQPDATGAIVLGFVGFVRTWHGLDTVIAAMAEHADAAALRLVVVGEGPARPELEAQAVALGIAGRISFTGLQPHEAIPALVAQFDIALQPRVVPYASPLKIFDYMAAGCAIVAPDQPNIREVLVDGENALLFDPDQPGAMWDAIHRLAMDPALRERLGEAARARIAQADYTWRGNAERVVAWAMTQGR
jgi:glycosyltransferase involved in cell wall biosynthesis